MLFKGTIYPICADSESAIKPQLINQLIWKPGNVGEFGYGQ